MVTSLAAVLVNSYLPFVLLAWFALFRGRRAWTLATHMRPAALFPIALVTSIIIVAPEWQRPLALTTLVLVGVAVVLMELLRRCALPGTLPSREETLHRARSTTLGISLALVSVGFSFAFHHSFSSSGYYYNYAAGVATSLLQDAVAFWVVGLSALTLSYAIANGRKGILRSLLAAALVVAVIASLTVDYTTVVFYGIFAAVIFLMSDEDVLSAFGDLAPRRFVHSAARRFSSASSVSQVGTVACIAAAGAVLAGVMFHAKGSASVVATYPRTLTTVATKSAAPPTGLGGQERDDYLLAQKHMPVLAFTGDEQWLPERAATYFTTGDARLALGDGQPGSRRTHTSVPSGVEELPNDCPALATEATCWRLSIGCRESKSGCALPSDFGSAADRDFRQDGFAYARVLRRGHAPKDGSPSPFPHRCCKNVGVLIQYWFFYTYDDWRARSFVGTLRQVHESDWESVSVGLSTDSSPLWVAMSAHCGGSVVPAGEMVWGAVELRARQHRVEFRQGPTKSATHPLVAVAEGSHANYPTGGYDIPNRWSECLDIPDSYVRAISWFNGIYDTTVGVHYRLPAAGLASADALPMAFRGEWGRDYGTSLVSGFAGKVIELAKPAAGPKSPPFQALWQDPLARIFESPYWADPQGIWSEPSQS